MTSIVLNVEGINFSEKRYCACSICLSPIDNQSETSSEDNEREFGSHNIRRMNGVDAKSLLKILDIDPDLQRLILETNVCVGNNVDGENIYSLCKPCHIEISKYDKLQVELRRIVDQIVSTILENLAFETSPLACLREFIFQRWKNHANNFTDGNVNTMREQSCNKASTFSTTVLTFAYKLGEENEDTTTNNLLTSIPVLITDTSATENICSATYITEQNNTIPTAEEHEDGNDHSDTEIYNYQIEIVNPGDQMPENLNEESSDNISTLISFPKLKKLDICKNIKEKTSKPKLYCEKCFQDFDSQELLEVHFPNCKEIRISRRGLAAKTCPFCPKCLPSNKMVKVHIETEHENESVIRCRQCRYFLNPHKPEEHNCQGPWKLRFDRKGPFICKECNKVYRQQRDLDVHIRRCHTGERPYACDICNKTYPASSALQHHKKVHFERYVCDICGKTVVTKNGLEKHLKIHQENKKFECEVCHKTFMWKQALTKHRVVHMAAEDRTHFVCQYCNRKFNFQDYLNKHIARRHTTEVGGNKTPLLRCPHCLEAKFRNAGNLSAHILKKHSTAESKSTSVCTS